MKVRQMKQVVEGKSITLDKKKAEAELALKEFGHELKRIRRSKKLTQLRLHEITGIDKTVISDLENGNYTPSLVLIRQLAAGLAVSPYILIAPYYGIPLPNYVLKDKETLEKFINLAIEYISSQPPGQDDANTIGLPDTKKLTPAQQKARHRRRSTDTAGGHAVADVTPDVAPPIDPQSPTGQEPTNPNPTNNSQ
jgi:transcriptional regulator with XRE-family HTH domain